MLIGTSTQRSMITIGITLVLATVMAIAGSHHGVMLCRWPVFACSVSLAFVINWLVFIPSFKLQTERYYDFTGSMTYILVTALSVVLSQPIDIRTFLLSLLMTAWALRLGLFLFVRIKKSGSDPRFDAIKPSALRFFMVWTLQALWISITAAAGLAAITSTQRVPLGVIGIVGIVLWASGFTIEVIADQQKNAHRAQYPNGDAFIQSGLWAWSRHPNYFGEIVLWTGIAILALPALSGWQHIALISPLFVYFLLVKISGIPMLEDKADKKWGDLPDYQQYKRLTPMLFPKKPSSV